MSAPRPVPDQAERDRALDPGHSFIVQAPAGSGKTELLIQRFLALLARVTRPEEILAITFTQKAAAQMRSRIFEALSDARLAARPVEAHKAKTWDLARAALDRNDALRWELEENAGRLRVQTIDALCASLTRQMPILARFGAQPETVEDASPLYLEAARNTLALLERENDPAAADVARLLAHLDNHGRQAEELLSALLRQRDHWLRQLRGADDRAALEAALAAARSAAVERARGMLPAALHGEWAALTEYIFGNLGLPSFEDTPEHWAVLARAWLTDEDSWRQRLTKTHGFPAGKPAQPWKERALALIGGLKGHEGFRLALCALCKLPPATYSESQWEALGAITHLLPRAVAELRVVFAARGQCDFVEIAQGALRALEGEEGPTDLALSLDHTLHHILVDEFQDTSFTQFELLEKLTAGWERGDGRTLFVVGDPMQSIYRFREAEVGLFLRAWAGGIGAVALTPLTLTANFRSQAGLVAWVNEAFGRIMPAQGDIAAGAVSYSASIAVHAAEPEAVTVHPFFNEDGAGAARRVATLAQQSSGKVAILVRNRRHLYEIVPRLKELGLPFRAIEIEPLGHRPVVQDLLALTRALSHLADRTAWLAILRAPWCGLTLADLAALIAPGETVWESMSDAGRIAALSRDAQARLSRVCEVLQQSLKQRGRVSLRTLIEGTWLALGGPACVERVTDLEDAAIYLDSLEASQEAGGIADLADFEAGMADLYALPDLNATERLEIMTIHKAKGLQFDTVIVPGLAAGTAADERKLFLWMERERDLLLAPINPTGSDRDPIYEFIRLLERERSDHENGRLLYVAATRAKKSLHLLGVVPLDEEGVPAPPPRASLLAKLWPVVSHRFVPDGAAEKGEAGSDSTAMISASAATRLRRLPASWRLPEPPPGVSWKPPPQPARAGEMEFSWVSETARHIGTVVHRWLELLAGRPLTDWDSARIKALDSQFRRQLQARGVPDSELPFAASQVAAALIATLADPRGRWLLAPHTQSQSELRLTTQAHGIIRHCVIDRTFVDEGTRWVVDFKTSRHEGGDLSAFLSSELERYRPQLQTYTELARELGPESVRAGLYFPLLSAFREL